MAVAYPEPTIENSELPYPISYLNTDGITDVVVDEFERIITVDKHSVNAIFAQENSKLVDELVAKLQTKGIYLDIIQAQDNSFNLYGATMSQPLSNKADELVGAGANPVHNLPNLETFRKILKALCPDDAAYKTAYEQLSVFFMINISDGSMKFLDPIHLKTSLANTEG